MNLTFTRKAGWIQINENSMYAEAGIISKGKETWPEIRSAAPTVVTAHMGNRKMKRGK